MKLWQMTVRNFFNTNHICEHVQSPKNRNNLALCRSLSVSNFKGIKKPLDKHEVTFKDHEIVDKSMFLLNTSDRGSHFLALMLN